MNTFVVAQDIEDGRHSTVNTKKNKVRPEKKSITQCKNRRQLKE